MEAAVREVPVEMARTFESDVDSDALKVDPFLDYINAILMEEGMDDAAYLQEVDNGSYQAIFSSFSDILAQPDSCRNSSSHEGALNPHLLHQYGLDEQHIKVASTHVGFLGEPRITVGPPGLSLPSDGHPQLSVNSAKPLHSSAISELLDSSCSRLNSNRLTEASGSSSSHEGIAGQNFGVLMDAMASCTHADAVVEGLTGHTRKGWHDDTSTLPSTDGFLSELAEVDLSFEDLKLDDDYTSLYIKQPSSAPAGAATHSEQSGDKKESLGGKGVKRSEKRASELPFFEDVREVLVSCAEAVAIGDAKGANKILRELQQVHGASPDGTGLQRTAFFFGQALGVRMRGQAEQEFRALSMNIPSTGMLLRASKFGFEVNPIEKISYYFGNQSILKAAEGASRLHIVDYAIAYGMQWPFLIKALAERKGTPPLLVITGVEFAHPSVYTAERLNITGQRLAAYAKTAGVPFQFNAIAAPKWEDLDAASLHCHGGEVLVLNCKRLRNLADESPDLSSTVSPRQKFFACLHHLKPHLVITTVVNAAYNSPFFVSRFREALYVFSNVFDMLDTLWGDSPLRRIRERGCFYHAIVNIVACEGAQRVDRPETYKQWHKHITEAGFELLPIPTAILCRSKLHVKQHYHKDFHVHDDANGWMLLGWKGRTSFAASAWKPCRVSRCKG